MKRRLTLTVALPITAGLMALGVALHSPANSGFAASSTPPPPPPTAPTPIGPPPPPPTNTATATLVPTATTAPTATPPPVGTDTPTPKPVKTTPVPAPATAMPTPPPVPPTATSMPVPTGTFHQGFGGTFHSPNGTNSRSSANGPAGSPSQLPRTGGGSGSNPTSPVALLVLFAGLIAAAGRMLPRFLHR